MDDKELLEYIYDKLFDNTLSQKEVKIEKVITDPELNYSEISFSIEGRRYILSVG